MNLVRLAVSAYVVLVAFASTAGADPLESMQIVWTSNRSGTYSVWRMNGDGSGVSRLTDDGGNDFTPSISPDGTRIAFASDRGGGSIERLYVMNADGSGIVQLADIPGLHVGYPSWSDDGTRIVFSANAGASSGAIYVVNADGTGLQPITSGYAVRPFFNPTETEIWFDLRTSSISFSSQLFKVNIDGTGLLQLTFGPVDESTTSIFGGFSPDGSSITYSRGHGIWTAGATIPLSSTTQLSAGSYPSVLYEFPSWSPDGNWLAFQHNLPSGVFDIYVMRPDGSGLLRLTDDPGVDIHARWGRLADPIPEPASVLLVSAGAVCLFVGRARRIR